MAELTTFLARLIRLDPQSLIRVRGTELWSRVPWNVLVTRTSEGFSGEFTVSAAAWLSLGEDASPEALPRLDAQWRTGVPAGRFIVRETLPTAVVRRISTAAAETLRETASAGLRGRAVGARVVRDALLDHVPITVAAEDGQPEIHIPQRLVQAMARLDFLGDDEEPVRIMMSGGWIGLSSDHGGAWWRPASALALGTHRA